MTKWRYGLAYLGEGVIEPDPESMPGTLPGNNLIQHFLEDAGQDGWELCALLPLGPKSCLVFKRPYQRRERNEE
jgi:hypothetical protein